MSTPKTVVLTGDRPTGALHLGHYVGSLQTRLLLQESHQQYVMIADMQALTDNGHQPHKVAGNILEVMADYLAVGLDPQKTHFCLQSSLPALAELTLFYMNVVSVSRVERNPTVKNEIRQKQFGRNIPAGFLMYPISQAADITAFGASCIPVGEDQLPMIEQTNEIVRKINGLFDADILTPCKALLSHTGRLPGIDGSAKMSKSMGNTLTFSASEEDIHLAVKAMYTDPMHLKVSDPGQVEGNVVFSWLDALHPDKKEVERMKQCYRQGGLGDMVCKRALEEQLHTLITPIRARRQALINDKAYLMSILHEGTRVAQDVTAQTVVAVKRGFGLPVFE